jgi:hypothetical protein
MFAKIFSIKKWTRKVSSIVNLSTDDLGNLSVLFCLLIGLGVLLLPSVQIGPDAASLPFWILAECPHLGSDPAASTMPGFGRNPT